MKKNYHHISIEETIKTLNTNKETGLDSITASKRLEENGLNALQGKKERSALQMFFEQFKDVLVIILIVAAVISGVMGDYIEAVAIISIVIINAVLGFTQENKASNALKALQEMSSPQSKVIRNGKVEKITSHDLVVGDLVSLEAGDYVPADVRFVESSNLKVDESALTGESVPVEKYASKIVDEESSLGDRINSGFMGTVVTYGRGLGLITDVGMGTEVGHIAKMLNETEDEATPLQKKLNKFGNFLALICLGVCVIIFALGLITKMPINEIFMTSVALAVAAIPEGLTIVVTVILAMGMQKMVKQNAIIKRLSAVETLGSTTVICSDKTGTLTQNKMTVVKLYDTQQVFDVSGTGYSSDGEILNYVDDNIDTNIHKLLAGAVLTNDATYDSEKGMIMGDPTEGALIVVGEKLNIKRDEANKESPRIRELPFDSTRKLMSTLHDVHGKFIMSTKGAPEELLNRCTKIYHNGKIDDLDDKIRKEIHEINNSFAIDALRVLGVAYKELPEIKDLDGEEEDLIFVGLLGMIDPPREEAKDAIDICKKAGIDVKMITGDHKITALAIAKDLGIADENSIALEGKEITELTDEELKEKVKTTNVFARVSPEHKVRIVSAIKENGNIVAMTGDGVNDAPSLKRADIGIAMGITGTDVSKEAADMILTDDNFASIVSAVEEGRTIYGNIRKVIGFLISCNIGEILLLLFAMIMKLFIPGLAVPLTAVQLLSINLITDAFPAFALGMEEKESGTMDVAPRDPNENLIDKKMSVSILFQSLGLAIGSLLSFLVINNMYDNAHAVTACFITIVLGELLRAYSARSEKLSIAKMDIFSNSFLNKSVILSVVFLILTVYVPFLNPIFETIPLDVTQVLIAVGFSILPIIAGEIAKKFINQKYD